MKILHISYSAGGGAGIAASRLHTAQRQAGVDSQFLSFDREQAGDGFIKQPPIRFSLLERCLIKVMPYRHEQHNERRKKSAGNPFPSGFSFPFSDNRVEENPAIQDADVIHLHWIAGMVHYPAFFKTVKQPIVWTLHDMNPFQGGFHYSAPADLPQGVIELENDLRMTKAGIYEKSSIRAIVAPSQWLTDLSASSPLLGRYPHRTIPYSLDPSVFRPMDSIQARRALGVPEGKPVLLMVCGDLSDPRKGFDLIRDAMAGWTRAGEFQVVAVGKVPTVQDPRVIYLGTIDDTRKMALAYNAADVFVLPSREDNLPNVMLEALCCGTPCIVTPAGGIPEAIKDGGNGWIADEISPTSLRQAIERFLESPAPLNRQQIADDAAARYAPDVQAAAYRSVYEHLVGTDDAL